MELNEKSNFILEYPADSGFEKTDIHFYSGAPNLSSLFFESKNEYPSRLFVTDKNIASLDCMKNFILEFENGKRKNDALLILDAGEKFKTIESVLQIITAALENNFNRNCLFVGIGGGVICDMTGFAASMFKRGVDVEFVSTTLLADVDASIGGKTGCDFSSYKNMIGAFYPAKQIHIWSDFIKYLPEKEYMSGLAEAIKTAFLFSKEMTEIFKTQKEKILNRDSEILELFITECAKAKAKIVHEDFKEKGKRAFLNLGHTFGHALESTAGLGDVTHGEGVAWGMARALDLASNKNLCTKEFAGECKALLKNYGYDTNPLHRSILNSKDAAKKIISAMHKDKKNSSKEITKVILQKNIEDTIITEATDEEILEVLK